MLSIADQIDLAPATATRVAAESGPLRIRAVTHNDRRRECAVLASDRAAVTKADVAKWGVALPDCLFEDLGC